MSVAAMDDFSKMNLGFVPPEPRRPINLSSAAASAADDNNAPPPTPDARMSTLSTPVVNPQAPEPPAADAQDLPELVIKARKGWIAVDWAELWSHRELLYFLVWRDVKV